MKSKTLILSPSCKVNVLFSVFLFVCVKRSTFILILSRISRLRRLQILLMNLSFHNFLTEVCNLAQVLLKRSSTKGKLDSIYINKACFAAIYKKNNICTNCVLMVLSIDRQKLSFVKIIIKMATIGDLRYIHVVLIKGIRQDAHFGNTLDTFQEHSNIEEDNDKNHSYLDRRHEDMKRPQKNWTSLRES